MNPPWRQPHASGLRDGSQSNAVQSLVAAPFKAKLKRANRERLQNKLDRKGKAKILQGEDTASDHSGAEVTDKVKVKLRDRALEAAGLWE